MKRFALMVSLVLVPAADLSAGCGGGQCGHRGARWRGHSRVVVRGRFRAVYEPVCTPQACPVPAPPPAPQVPAPAPSKASPTRVVAVDPYGFCAWLNAVRARHGLRPVRRSVHLEAWSVYGNSLMRQRGFGHHVFFPRQCIAACANFPGPPWLASSGHAAVLLDPRVVEVGLAAVATGDAYSTYWSLSVNP